MNNFYRKGILELDVNYLNGWRLSSVIVKNYHDKRSGWTGPVIITLISCHEKARLMKIVVEREKSCWWHGQTGAMRG